MDAASMDQAKFETDLAKTLAETAKLNAETSKINRESTFYPLIAGSTATLAIVAIAKLFL